MQQQRNQDQSDHVIENHLSGVLGPNSFPGSSLPGGSKKAIWGRGYLTYLVFGPWAGTGAPDAWRSSAADPCALLCWPFASDGQHFWIGPAAVSPAEGFCRAQWAHLGVAPSPTKLARIEEGRLEDLPRFRVPPWHLRSRDSICCQSSCRI